MKMHVVKIFFTFRIALAKKGGKQLGEKRMIFLLLSIISS